MRHKTHTVKVGDVSIGGNNPIVVQSMTDTDTTDAVSTANQIAELYNAGSELVRITVNSVEAGNTVPEIRQLLIDMGIDVPIVGDFHYNGHKILKESKCAKYLDKYRINPGNVGKGSKRDEQFMYMIKTAIEYDKPVRIGVNWGSLDQELLKVMLDDNSQLDDPLELKFVMRKALIESALQSAEQAIEYGLSEDKIIISCKVSKISELIPLYKELSLKSNYPLHLGLTEAGMGIKGTVVSSIAIASLLQSGIGDTIRVSLTPTPGDSRDKEVLISRNILQALELRAFTPEVTACPGCGRTSSDYFQHLTLEIQDFVSKKIKEWKNVYYGVENLKVAVMGCVVNGPGESKMADIGISLPGKGEQPVAPVYVDGEHYTTLKGDNIAVEFKRIIEVYVSNNYATI